MTGLTGKTFVVTGGSSGIGAATVMRLLSQGANVVAAGRSEQRLARMRQNAKNSDRLIMCAFDLEDEASIIMLVAEAVRHFGQLDGVANVAAAVVPEIMARDQGVYTLDPELWTRIFRINLIGTGLVIRESLPHLVRAGGGTIVNISSAAAWLGEDQRVAYAASKTGIHALTRHTARAWGKHNIRCNAVAPGKVLSETGATMMPQLVAGFNEALLAKMCMPRLGEPADVASMIAFLLSGEGSWITGQVLSVDGGLTMRE